MTTQTKNKPTSFTDRLRNLAQPVLKTIARGLLNLGITPNTATLIGALGNIIAAVLIALGFLTWGGLVALFWVLFDAIDGTMARISGQTSKAGAFLDSTLDRYVEFFLLTGLLWHFLANNQRLGVLLTMVTLAGSILVSYTRARAEGLGLECKVGLLTRVERFMIFIPSLLFHFPIIGMISMAILTHITAIQRIIHVVRQAGENE
ncbi:MAG: CDP-alcohol phosphatidyltransferase family protein [Anaerolineae bacterium]|jgi:CDP-diacylglycerol--glycerol-3-phosphate 3-phosphatidyltransferase|nr:CDP-alcohol phosphatidyltransferase family protein [Anaerolineae bacterium]